MNHPDHTPDTSPEDIARIRTASWFAEPTGNGGPGYHLRALCTEVERLRGQFELRRPLDGTGGGTHWLGCWREHGHHPCAVAEVERLQAARLRGIDQPDSPPPDEVPR